MKRYMVEAHGDRFKIAYPVDAESPGAALISATGAAPVSLHGAVYRWSVIDEDALARADRAAVARHCNPIEIRDGIEGFR